MSEEEPESFYTLLGGDDAIAALVERFYDEMDSAPEAAGIRAMHARSLKSSRQKLYEFLSGWTGGPQRYIEKYGHPRLRRRHLPFAIDVSARDQWMFCMDRALDACVEDPRVRAALRDQLAHVADFMRNQVEPEG